MPTPQEYLSISNLAKLLNDTLEAVFSRVYFTGEITEYNKWSSGHLYFTLKDQESQLSCVMWKSNVAGLGFTPKVGDVVLCTGKPNLYPKNGRFQMVVTSMQPSGAGILQQKFLALKAKLEAEGLFASERKRALPFFPETIGVVTSSQGAVIHDIMVRIKERMPNLKVFLVDVKVQGPGAAEEIAAGVRLLNERGEVEVIIVARGGGSLEDLWAFNEEVVVRAIFASRIPVVSGVGHEVDVTLADLVADVRAPTPTAAAEMVVPHRKELLRQIDELSRRLSDVDRWFQPIVQEVDDLEARLVRSAEATLLTITHHVQHAEALVRGIHPARVISLFREKIDTLRGRMVSGGIRDLANARRAIDLKRSRLQNGFSLQHLVVLNERVRGLQHSLRERVEGRVREMSGRIEGAAKTLSAVSPLRVLERGFSIVESKGKIVSRASQLNELDEFEITLSQGRVVGSVKKTEELWRKR